MLDITKQAHALLSWWICNEAPAHPRNEQSSPCINNIIRVSRVLFSVTLSDTSVLYFVRHYWLSSTLVFILIPHPQLSSCLLYHHPPKKFTRVMEPALSKNVCKQRRESAGTKMERAIEKASQRKKLEWYDQKWKFNYLIRSPFEPIVEIHSW